jgi:phosphatidylserine/phosphatidylglycerophosphate/cardiolipin synthase-like enzyme
MKHLAYFLAICLLILGCQLGSGVVSTAQPVTVVPSGVIGTPGVLTDIPMRIGYGVSGSWFELYFTDPTNPAQTQETGGPDGPLAASLDSARVTIDMAAYSLNLRDVESSLLHAQRRGVKVRLVMETDNMGGTVPKALMAAGIPIVGDGLPGLMHDKFVVIDRAEVWTGSMNFSISGTYRDNNNLMHIRSTKVAEDYETEFDQMFENHRFGPKLISDTPHPSVTIDGTPLNIYFSPADHIQSALLPLIDNARSSITFLAYSFTSDPLGNAIRRRAEAGVEVAGVLDADQVRSNVGTEYDAFRKAGLDVRLDGNPGLMHHKVIIIDERMVVMGSYNFTASAEKNNDENLLVVDDPEIAAQYMNEFQRVYAAAQP